MGVWSCRMYICTRIHFSSETKLLLQMTHSKSLEWILNHPNATFTDLLKVSFLCGSMDFSEMACPTQRVRVCLLSSVPKRRRYIPEQEHSSGEKALAPRNAHSGLGVTRRQPPGAAHSPGVTPGLLLWSLCVSYGFPGGVFCPRLSKCRMSVCCPCREHMLWHTIWPLCISPAAMV